MIDNCYENNNVYKQNTPIITKIDLRRPASQVKEEQSQSLMIYFLGIFSIT